MSIRISNLRLGLDISESALAEQLTRVLGSSAAACPWRILRKSLDARDKDRLQFVYSVEVQVPDDAARLAELARKKPAGHAHVERYLPTRFIMPEPGTRPLAQRPVVIGSGPGGLAAAYFLAEQG